MDYQNFSSRVEPAEHKTSLPAHLCRLITALVSIVSHTLALLVLIFLCVLIYLINKTSDLDPQLATQMLSAQNLTPQDRAATKTPVLYFDLSGSVVEYPFSDSQIDSLARMLDERLTGRSTHSILDLEAALKYAAEDSELKELVFNLDQLSELSLSNAERICAALSEVKRQDPHKKITVFATYFTAPEYLIACHADRVVLDPLGGVQLQGIGISNLYYRELFDRFKVEPYVFRAGAYKAAVEPYLRSGMSPEVKEEMGHIISEFWDLYQNSLKERKSLQGQVLPDALTYLRSLREQGGLQAQMDLQRGLVDEVKPLNLIKQEYAAKYGTYEDTLDPKVTGYLDYLRLSSPQKKSDSAQVAVLYGLGVIDQTGERPLDFTPGNLLPLMDQVALTDEIKAVVLYINSPGGEVDASEQIRRGLQELRDRGKKVVISMHDTAASGAYLVASASDYIMATPHTLTGSIGVFAISFGVSQILNEYGVQEDGVTTHPFAEAYLGKPLPAELKAIFQTQVEGTYRFFIDTVTKARKLKAEDYLQFAEGRVFLSEEAEKLGLIDARGDLEAAITKACELAGLKRDEVEPLHLIPGEQNSFNLLQRLILRGSLQVLPLQMVKAELDYFSSLRRLQSKKNGTPSIMALSPWHTLYGQH